MCIHFITRLLVEWKKFKRLDLRNLVETQDLTFIYRRVLQRAFHTGDSDRYVCAYAVRNISEVSVVFIWQSTGIRRLRGLCLRPGYENLRGRYNLNREAPASDMPVSNEDVTRESANEDDDLALPDVSGISLSHRRGLGVG